jgi:putative membrane protein
MSGHLINALIFLIALQHLWFFALEAVFWRKPLGLRTFRMSQEKADLTAFLAKNQGLYNGFLAAGLIWSLVSGDPAHAFSLKVFFLACILVAGIYGSLTAARSILWIQGLPAAVALVLLWFLAP